MGLIEKIVLASLGVTVAAVIGIQTENLLFRNKTPTFRDYYISQFHFFNTNKTIGIERREYYHENPMEFGQIVPIGVSYYQICPYGKSENPYLVTNYSSTFIDIDMDGKFNNELDKSVDAILFFPECDLEA